MDFRRIISALAALVLLGISASAQSTIPLPKNGETGGGGFSGRAAKKQRANVIGTTIDINSIPRSYGKFADDRLEELDRNLKERSWLSESSAWETASGLNTTEAYQRYLATFPNGAHSPQANKALIDSQVNDIMKGAHDNLPAMNQTSDEESPVSYVTVINATEYPMTVYYSGVESKSIKINPGGRGMVSLKNGRYKIAASVPNPSVRPFAGSEDFTGGRYQGGYTIVAD